MFSHFAGDAVDFKHAEHKWLLGVFFKNRLQFIWHEPI